MDKEEGQQNMISNLPLLFASGYPTSLDKISETQLENFIPFMVQCSLGHINTQGRVKCGEPEWWPEDVPYIIPFTKPRKFTGNWMEKMKEIVIICYQFHKSIFLLKFCNDLASYEHASLRFINNYNSTTSLFDRRNNKLLVTFRNENMSYDQPQRNRKCLLKQKKNGLINGQQEVQQMMVEPAPFDIYLCDNCDAELYSKEAILEHEKTCIVDADDVILCDTPDPERLEKNACNTDTQADISMNEITPTSEEENKELRNSFLLNFNLQCNEISTSKPNKTTGNVATTSRTITPAVQDDKKEPALEKRRRLTRRNRAVHSLTRCPSIPLSSPAGMLLLRTTMPCTTAEYLNERLERLERFCHAPVITKAINRPKFLEKRYVPNCNNCTFKKPQGYHLHNYVFPRRQYAQRRRAEACLLNLSLLRRCRRMTVRIKKIPDHDQQKRASLMKNACRTSVLSSNSSALNIKLKRETTSGWKISKPTKEVVVDTINLCSSDDDDDDDEQPPAKIKKVIANPAIDFNLNTAEVTITPALTTTLRQRLNASIRSQCTISGQNNDKSIINNLQTILNDKNNLTITRKSISYVNNNTINNNISNERTKFSINKILSTSLPLASGNPSTSTTLLQSLAAGTMTKTSEKDVLLNVPAPAYLFSNNNKNINATAIAGTSGTSISKITTTTNKLTATMLTKTLPLSKSGHNRQHNNNHNNHNNNNNSNNNYNYNLLSQHFSMKSSELNLSRDVIVKRLSTSAINNNNNKISKITPANWVPVNSTINRNTMSNNNNNNINKNQINNNINNLVITPTHITANNSTPNLSSVENRIVSIDLTL